MKEYESKSYFMLVLILAFMIVSGIAIPILLKGVVPSNMLTKFTYIDVGLVMSFLSWVIYKKERIYWLNNFTYDQACEMDPEERTRISELLFRSFGKGCMLITLCMIAFLIINTPFWLDLTVFTGGLIFIGVYFTMEVNKEMEE